MMMNREVDIVLVALTAWREARGEGAQGMNAVLHVMLNRSKAWGKTIRQIVVQRNQFSSMTVQGDPDTVMWPMETDKAFQAALVETEKVLSGQDDDPTDNALYYYNPNTATSSWFLQNIVNSPRWHPQTATIGNHTFFK
jgi:N-acetylmuramoyl-L-alanine amidase